MRHASFGASACPKAAMGAVRTTEATMQEHTVIDLIRLTRAELYRLDHEMTVAVVHLPEYSEARTVALANRRHIARELDRRDHERDLGLGW